MNFVLHKKAVLVGFILMSLLSTFSKAQLTTSTALTPAQLVQTVLLGTGITASNITYTGSALARGTFNGTASNLGISTGVLLATGKISNAVGPNNNTGITTVFNLPGDADLNIITSPALSYDAAILEFDFIPRTDTVSFRYIFASEEYMEFVNSPPLPPTVNDGFGFFISGPGIAGPFSGGAQNIAKVPGTALPVTMYNLSLNNNSAYYFDNGDGSGTGTAPDGATVQYDGFTVPLTATAVVQCGQTYHIKIAIGDGFDHNYDSGVFLEAGSFSSTENIVITSTTYVANALEVHDTVLHEGCGHGRIHFKRIASACDLINPDTVHFTISGTAINGIDYTTIADSIIFPANFDTTSIYLAAIPDALIEGNETITLTVVSSNTTNQPSSITITIIDSPPLTVNLNNDTTFNCPPGSLLLTANAVGGASDLGYQYVWTNTSSATNTATVFPLQTTTYYVSATDVCGNTARDSVHVIVTAYTPMQLNPSQSINSCSGSQVIIKDTVTNGRPAYSYNWNPGGATTDSLVVSPTSTTNYVLTITDQCGQQVHQTVTVNTNFIQADFNFVFTTNQNVQFNNASLGAVSYQWLFGDNSTDSISTEISPAHYFRRDGTFTVRLIATNSEGCTDTAFQTLIVLPDFYFYYPNSFTPNGDGRNDIFSGNGVGIKSYRMRIFDRFGELVFDTIDMQKGWDGMYGGAEAEIGVYVCMFELETYNSKLTTKYGNITLIR